MAIADSSQYRKVSDIGFLSVCNAVRQSQLTEDEVRRICRNNTQLEFEARAAFRALVEKYAGREESCVSDQSANPAA